MGHETEMRYTANKALIEKVVSVWSLLLMLDYLAKFYLERDLGTKMSVTFLKTSYLFFNTCLTTHCIC